MSLAVLDDLPQVIAGLQRLARDLGDPFRITPDMLSAALFGPERHAFAMLARGRDAPLGIALCSPVVSTMLGHSCLYITDLWVAAEARGQALGRRLLEAAARAGDRRWQAQSLVLTVYADNDGAGAFYRRLGFDIRAGDKRAILTGKDFARLVGQPAEV